MLDFTNALVARWEQTPAGRYQNLVESPKSYKLRLLQQQADDMSAVTYSEQSQLDVHLLLAISCRQVQVQTFPETILSAEIFIFYSLICLILLFSKNKTKHFNLYVAKKKSGSLSFFPSQKRPV